MAHGIYTVLCAFNYYQMEKPNKEKYGYVESTGFDSEPSGFVIEGGEEAYEEAMKRWQFMQDNGLSEEDMINDITYPKEL